MNLYENFDWDEDDFDEDETPIGFKSGDMLTPIKSNPQYFDSVGSTKWRNSGISLGNKYRVDKTGHSFEVDRDREKIFGNALYEIYDGELIKFETLWPWFKMEDFQLFGTNENFEWKFDIEETEENNEIKNTMPKKLKDFLSFHNALDKYIDNVKLSKSTRDYSKMWNNAEELFSYGNDSIVQAFSWKNSSEKYKYWDNLHKKLNNMNENFDFNEDDFDFNEDDFDFEEEDNSKIYEGQVWDYNLKKRVLCKYRISQLEFSDKCYFIFNKDKDKLNPTENGSLKILNIYQTHSVYKSFIYVLTIHNLRNSQSFPINKLTRVEIL